MANELDSSIKENITEKRRRTFLDDAVDFIALGAHSLHHDDFSDCFKPNHSTIIHRHGFFHPLSVFIRYSILLPFRVFILAVGTYLLGILFLFGKHCKYSWVINTSILLFNKLMLFVLNCKITHIGTKKARNEPHIYVANHTTFIDYLILSSHRFSHACIAEKHSGLFGFFLTHILASNGSIGFKRSDRKNKEQVLDLIKKHIEGRMAPMLIFPEGTCVDNESILLFQKGSFEYDSAVCPVAIKYKKDTMDPYWNRRSHGFVIHLFYLMTRWGMQAEVHWMEPLRRSEDESTVAFSHRVKNAIANRIQLRNTLWNGYFKSSPVLKDREILKSAFLDVYSNMKRGLLQEQRAKDITEGRLYLLDENIESAAGSGRVYFGGITYRKYVNECCKEYLRRKERSGGQHQVVA